MGMKSSLDLKEIMKDNKTMTKREMAKKYNVSAQTIYYAVYRATRGKKELEKPNRIPKVPVTLEEIKEFLGNKKLMENYNVDY